MLDFMFKGKSGLYNQTQSLKYFLKLDTWDLESTSSVELTEWRGQPRLCVTSEVKCNNKTGQTQLGYS